MGIRKILFVCTGNICRSPMAEGLFKAMYPEVKIEVESRGLMTYPGQPASKYAIMVMREKGVSIENHRSKPFDFSELGEDVLVVTMTQRHKQDIRRQTDVKSVYTLKEYVGESGDVEDPYGGNLAVYKLCADEIEYLIQKLEVN